MTPLIASSFDWLWSPDLVRAVGLIALWGGIILGSLQCLRLLAGRRDS